MGSNVATGSAAGPLQSPESLSPRLPVTRFAAVQMSSQADVGANLERAVSAIAGAARAGAKVVVLPENFAYLGDDDGKRALAEEIPLGATPGPIAQSMASAARTHNVVVVAGGMPERSDDPARPYNTCAVFDTSGSVVATYRKIHLFDVDLGERRYRESAATMPGDTPHVATVAGLRVGLSICYDLRFPELYRALSREGTEVLLVPAAFTVTTGKDHWHVLLRARAIEAQCYVVAPAQWGKHPRGRVTYGKTCIVDPWGDVIAQAPEGEAMIVADIDAGYLERVRAELPSLAHRKLR